MDTMAMTYELTKIAIHSDEQFEVDKVGATQLVEFMKKLKEGLDELNIKQKS